VFYDTFSANRLYHATEVGNVSHKAGRERGSIFTTPEPAPGYIWEGKGRYGPFRLRINVLVCR